MDTCIYTHTHVYVHMGIRAWTHSCMLITYALRHGTHLYKIVYRVGRYHKNRNSTVRFYNVTVLLNITILSSSQSFIVYTFKLLSHLSASKFNLKS